MRRFKASGRYFASKIDGSFEHLLYTSNMEGVEFTHHALMEDSRGAFVKFFQASSLHSSSSNLSFAEFFRNHTYQGGVRGFHLQIAPAENYRVIHVVHGVIHDVLLDLRPESKTYLHIEERTMSSSTPSSLVLPPGVAHAFQAVEEADLFYGVTSEYAPEFDTGVNVDSVYQKWPLAISVISERDQCLPSLDEWIHGRR